MNDPDKLNDFGIRVEIQEDDPFINLIGKNWSTEYWFNDQFVRDEALKDMSSEHISDYDHVLNDYALVLGHGQYALRA